MKECLTVSEDWRQAIPLELHGHLIACGVHWAVRHELHHELLHLAQERRALGVLVVGERHAHVVEVVAGERFAELHVLVDGQLQRPRHQLLQHVPPAVELLARHGDVQRVGVFQRAALTNMRVITGRL
jgi:hypothetical protein